MSAPRCFIVIVFIAQLLDNLVTCKPVDENRNGQALMNYGYENNFRGGRIDSGFDGSNWGAHRPMPPPTGSLEPGFDNSAYIPIGSGYIPPMGGGGTAPGSGGGFDPGFDGSGLGGSGGGTGGGSGGGMGGGMGGGGFDNGFDGSNFKPPGIIGGFDQGFDGSHLGGRPGGFDGGFDGSHLGRPGGSLNLDVRSG